MTNNKSNTFNTLITAIDQLQKQHPDLVIDPLLFTFPFKKPEELDLKILSINLFHDQEKEVFYYQILCCGSDAHRYAEELSWADPDISVFCHSLQGTRDGMEIFSITIISY